MSGPVRATPVGETGRGGSGRSTGGCPCPSDLKRLGLRARLWQRVRHADLSSAAPRAAAVAECR